MKTPFKERVLDLIENKYVSPSPKGDDLARNYLLTELSNEIRAWEEDDRSGAQELRQLVQDAAAILREYPENVCAEEWLTRVKALAATGGEGE